MCAENDNSRQKFLQGIRANTRIMETRYSKAWINTQRTLKRSGMSCARIGTNDRFDFIDVRYLYMLHSAAELINTKTKFPDKVELTKIETCDRRILSSYMLIPGRIRRKAESFRQLEKIKPHISHEFKGSLYTVLCQEYKSKDYVDDMIVKLPISKLERATAAEFNIDSYRNICSGGTSVFKLLRSECKRLGYHEESKWLLKIGIKIKNSEILDKFACALFFSLAYRERTVLFTPFFEKLNNEKIDSEIDNFTLAIYKKYLTPACVRYRNKKQQAI